MSHGYHHTSVSHAASKAPEDTTPLAGRDSRFTFAALECSTVGRGGVLCPLGATYSLLAASYTPLSQIFYPIYSTL